ncbi:hypothetical protein PspLS_01866 [Pyricularia sp. CBS 133598]|nr:hypothetical protein PspLS_01866 [Pyricularia sp. CBS 133598]
MFLHSFILSLALLSGSAIAQGQVPVKSLYRVDLRFPQTIEEQCDNFICRDQLLDTPNQPFGITFTTRLSADKFLKTYFPNDAVHVYIVEVLDTNPKNNDLRPHMIAAETAALAYLRDPTKTHSSHSKLEMSQSGLETQRKMKNAIEQVKQGKGEIPLNTIATEEDQNRVRNSPWKKVDGWVLPLKYNYPIVTWNRKFVPYNPGPQLIRDACRYIQNCGRSARGKSPKDAPVPLIPLTDSPRSPNAPILAPARGKTVLRSDHWLHPAN